MFLRRWRMRRGPGHETIAPGNGRGNVPLSTASCFSSNEWERANVTDLSRITCVEDFRRIAKRRVPRMFYDYADSGSWTEGTYRINNQDLQKLEFRQRVATNIEQRSVRTTMLGEDVAMPVAIAPTGLTGMRHADGEILGAQA